MRARSIERRPTRGPAAATSSAVHRPTSDSTPPPSNDPVLPVRHATDARPEPSTPGREIARAVEGALPELPEKSEPLTAASLFARASAARGAGHRDEAIGLLQQLQRLFPASAEAQIGQFSLGRLLLSSARPREALLQFSRYLETAGPLAEEALLGTARAHAALGQAEQERRAWDVLLARYPGSVYANEAWKRLGHQGATRTE